MVLYFETQSIKVSDIFVRNTLLFIISDLIDKIISMFFVDVQPNLAKLIPDTFRYSGTFLNSLPF